MREPATLEFAPGDRDLGRFLLGRYDRRSLVALVLLVTVAASVGYRWSDLVDVSGVLDLLLLGIWILMASLITWNVSPRQDLLLIAIGAAGGGVIEWWGTNTQTWSYFTGERPPLWIIPAWPAAALTVDRIRTVLDRCAILAFRGCSAQGTARGFRIAYFALLPAFVLWMTLFVRPTLHLPVARAMVALMLLVALHSREPRRDVLLFVAGSMLGVALEYWGTTRECWTYYTQQQPPPVAVVAHGFASVAFGRALDGCQLLLAWLGGKTVARGSSIILRDPQP